MGIVSHSFSFMTFLVSPLKHAIYTTCPLCSVFCRTFTNSIRAWKDDIVKTKAQKARLSASVKHGNGNR